MNPEQHVRDALRALAEQDRRLQSSTPAATLFRQRRSGWNVGAPLLAAAALLLMFWRPAERPAAPAPVQTAAVARVPEETPKPVAKVARRTKRKTPVAPREVVTEFYPLMDMQPPFERGQLLRVVVPASTMRRVGLAVNPAGWDERVSADVLVGEEGMARAIRFVSYER